ncbi:MAG: 5'-methylthioadenosine/adenosylhomocysteine nucleosidase [Spirochaetaceae bacterium]|jgi:adenosylhomocysteine nucleosidase|nr:5'-methylthioadenosine/adenosylhomocysteine nucleosidase [Spirochaetaceae bacterium]
MKKIGIIGAMDEEIEHILKAMDGIRTETGAGLTFYAGMYDSVEIVAVKSGIGKVNAALCTQKLISDFHVDAVINTGIAGGVAPGLKVLDQVISTDAIQHDVDATSFGYKPGVIPQLATSLFIADGRLREAAAAVHREAALREGGFPGRVIEGRIASGDVFVASGERKKKIYEEFKPLCVEMEGAAIAQVCHLNGIPFLVLRCISDLADEKADITYEELSMKAADMSSRLVLGMISKLKNQ